MTKLDDKIAQKQKELESHPPGDTGRAAALHSLAVSLSNKFMETKVIQDLEEAIAVHQSALDLRPPGHSDRSDSLHHLALCFSDRYDKQGTIADLEEAITLGRAALDLRSPDHSGRAVTLYKLAKAMRYKFLKLGANGDLNDAISLHRSALDLRLPGHSDRSDSLHQLALCLSNRYDKQGSIADLEEAITLGRAALDLRSPGHSGRAVILNRLANDMRRKFLKLGANGDLDEAISLHRSALDLRPAGHSDQSDLLHRLALCLSDRYDKQGTIADLEEVITLGRAALDLRSPGHSGRAVTLSRLANNMRRKFLKLGANGDLDEAISLHRSALDLRPPGHSDQSSSLHRLALCLSDRYDKQGAIADLEEAITLGRAALELHSPGHSWRSMTLYNLACDLRNRFLEFSANGDLDEAISLHRSALDLRLPGHSDRSSSLHQLALCLSNRYNKQGSIADLEEAITLGRAALDLRSPGHSGRAVTLNRLANDMRRKFLKLDANGGLEDSLHQSRLHNSKRHALIELDRAHLIGCRESKRGITASLQQEVSKRRLPGKLSLSGSFTALDLHPVGHSNRSVSFHDLAVYFSDQYDKQGTTADLDWAITLGRAALELHSPGHSDRASTLRNLANDMMRKFLDFGANGDLDEAISLHRSALVLRPAGHSDRLASLDQLASCLSSRFEKLEAAADLDELMSLRRAILDLHPQGHHDHAKSIDKLLLLFRKRIQRHCLAADLDECISLGRSALASCEPGSPGRATYLHDLVTDLHSGFRKLEHMSDVQETHPHHAASLHRLLIYVKDNFEDGDVAPVVDAIVAIARAALKRYPTGHPYHVMSLTTLAAFLVRRFQHQGAVSDADEAVILYQEALEVCPSGSPASAPHLHDLARCLSGRFTKLAKSTDLDDAIKFEQEALALYPQGHPNHAESLRCLYNYRQLKIKGRGTNTQSAYPTGTTSGSQFKYFMGNIVFEILKGFPTRLLDTRTGMLCDRHSQIAQFEKSGEYNLLLSSASAMDASAQVTHIRKVVSTYFRYVTLSHRWGQFEPLLRDIDGQVVYDLNPTNGISKLQFFCQECCRHGYLWAWSDTCCIDKESSAELQEAIGSMFSWYRLSALTLVHLADVSNTGELASSEWFKRGWTLQELLAPRTVLFCTRDWSLYQDSSSNHKKDSAILGELEQATGITSHHLIDFHPGVDDARSRLQWASKRCTTRPEDIAYSLLGVFGLHIPVLYGESAENALGRLLGEVISKSGDTSILDWVGQSSAFHSCFPATIVPYQTLPVSLPDLTTLPSVRRIRNLFFLRFARKMLDALSDLPLAKFANFRLILPCIVYRIKAITVTRVDTSTSTHVHQIQAAGLSPIDIALSERLENTAKGVPYVLIRPWHSSLLHPVVNTDDTSWLTRLEQPFSALLLKELPHKEYRRVASFCHILACPTDSAGVLKGKVNTLTIV